MSTATTHPITTAPPPLEVPGPVLRVPSLEEMEDLTDFPDRRVVFRGVNWAFYDQLVESIPEWRKIHVDFDGKDLEIVRYSIRHAHAKSLLGKLVSISAEESETPHNAIGCTTWKRPEISRGLEADESYYFDREKLVVSHAAFKRDSDDIADYPNPDLAVEVDLTPPQVDRAGIYAALQVAEVWRFDGVWVVIERLSSEGTYKSVESSGFLPIRAEDLRRWLVDEDYVNDLVFSRGFRAEIKKRLTNESRSGFPA